MNFGILLREDESFRHFFCYEVRMERMKAKLNDLMNIEQLIDLEEEFPEVIRIGEWSESDQKKGDWYLGKLLFDGNILLLIESTSGITEKIVKKQHNKVELYQTN